MAAILAPGFAGPILGSQRVFRRVLDALARPGRPIELTDCLPEAPRGLLPSTYALLLALADYETPVWLAPGLDQPPVRDALRFHTGCPVMAETASAAFAVADGPEQSLPLERFAPGTPEFPDRSTTLLVQCGGEGATGQALLSGPGIEQPLTVVLPGVTATFWRAAARNAARFPLGVDIILAWPERIVGLPRSTQIEVR
jgi:alpha-D-ribose 1-methylphosphonate 5-triphosphate synthase subunit PhnH